METFKYALFLRENVSIFGQQKTGNNGNIGEEWRLYFTPHDTLIRELYRVVKPSLIPGAGLGLFTALSLCEDQTIGIMTGTPVAQSSQGESSVDIDIVSSMFGMFCAD